MVSQEVVVALIALIGVIVVGGVSALITVVIARRQRENEMVITALSHLVGGTQERTAGISALKILIRPKGSASKRYIDAVEWEFQAQMVYVLAHGSRRWAAHEVANVIAMGSWLFRKEQAKPEGWVRDALLGSMNSYLKTSPEGEYVHAASVAALKTQIAQNWLPWLGAIPARIGKEVDRT